MTISEELHAVNRNLEDIKHAQKEEQQEMEIRIKNMEELVKSLQKQVSNELETDQKIEELKI